MVGLPGAGLGNLFFLICALLSLPVELVRTLLGRGSRARWKRAVHHTTLAAFVLSVVAGTYWALQLGLQFGRARPEAAIAGEDEFSAGVGVWAASGDAPASVSQAGSHVLSLPFDSILFAPVLATLTVLVLVLALAYALKRVVHGSAYDSASLRYAYELPGHLCARALGEQHPEEEPHDEHGRPDRQEHDRGDGDEEAHEGSLEDRSAGQLRASAGQ